MGTPSPPYGWGKKYLKKLPGGRSDVNAMYLDLFCSYVLNLVPRFSVLPVGLERTLGTRLLRPHCKIACNINVFFV